MRCIPLPCPGRIVHYFGPILDPENPTLVMAQTQAAIITGVVVEPTAEEPDTAVVDLAVFTPDGLVFRQDVAFAKEPTLWHWSWPDYSEPLRVPDEPPPPPTLLFARRRLIPSAN